MGFGTSVLRRKAGSPEGCQGADGVVSWDYWNILEFTSAKICQHLFSTNIVFWLFFFVIQLGKTPLSVSGELGVFSDSPQEEA